MKIEILFSDYTPLSERELDHFLELLKRHENNDDITHGITLSLLTLGYKISKED